MKHIVSKSRNGNGSDFSIPGLDSWAEPGPFTKWIFFSGARTRPCGLHGPCGLWYFRAYSVAQLKKKNVCLILIFLATKPEGKKNTQENPLFSQQPTDLNNQKPTKPIIFSAINRSETLFFFITIFSHIKSKNKN